MIFPRRRAQLDPRREGTKDEKKTEKVMQQTQNASFAQLLNDVSRIKHERAQRSENR